MLSIVALVARAALPATCALALLGAATAATAQSSTGSLLGWSAYGDAVSTGGRITLTTASLDAELLGDAASNLSGRSAVDIAVVEAAAGVPAYGLDLSTAQYGTEGSLVKQTFNASAGQLLRFDWSFATLESAAAGNGIVVTDRAFVVLNGTVSTLATALAPGSATQTFTQRVSSTGPLTLAFGVIDTVDPLGVSSLTVGSLQLVTAPVPEPATGALLVGGLIAVASLVHGKRPRRRGFQDGSGAKPG